VHLAGHPPPLLVAGDHVEQLEAPVSPPLGVGAEVDWPGVDVRLADRWAVLLYTDGLIEGRIDDTDERLGIERLTEIVGSFLRITPASTAGARRDERLLDLMIDRVQELNGGELDDDLAVLSLGSLTWAHRD
jgi:serine phosphatase RsbU (regulator of sigma subunit)